MHSVRMGEFHVSSRPGDEIGVIGLGSCIGLALLDRRGGIAGVAHIVLPESNGADGPSGKFADTGVPALVADMCRAGAISSRLEAVLAGGAQMFAATSKLAVGPRNEEAVRSALATRRIPIRAAATGGERGRTLNVTVGDFSVSVREAGRPAVELLASSQHTNSRKERG